MANIMVQGTASSAGKSLICTGLCRIFKEDGYRVYPFKAQNMSSIYYTTKERHKMSTAQALQAIAAGVEPKANMNPILLIPKSDKEAMVVIKSMVLDTYKEIKNKSDIVVIEGAGSPAEINQKETVMLLEPNERERIKGLIINKFRGIRLYLNQELG